MCSRCLPPCIGVQKRVEASNGQGQITGRSRDIEEMTVKSKEMWRVLKKLLLNAKKCLNCLSLTGMSTTTMRKDEISTTLIPREAELNNCIALQTTGNGNCMFNAASLLLAGNESLSDVIRLLIAGELFFFSEHYIQTIQDRFFKLENDTPYSEATVFSTILTEAGAKETTNSKNRLEAIHAEARDTCLTNNWNGMVKMMALSTVLPRPIFSVYPEANPALRPIPYWTIPPQRAEEHDNPLEQVQNNVVKRW